MRQICKIQGLDCANCAQKLENKLNQVFPAAKFTISFMSERMTIDAPVEVFDQIKKDAIQLIGKLEPDVNVIL